MSLKNSWQQQRQQRQQELVERQQMVSQSLSAARQERQLKAAQLRADLSLFRTALASENIARRTELQQFCQRLQAETQALLTAAGDRRQIQAAQLAHDLTVFVQLLRQKTADFLVTAQFERLTAAQQLEQELIAFVDDLRSDVQSYLVELEAVRKMRATQLNQVLLDHRAKRELETQELFQRLAVFRAELQRFCQDLHGTVWGDNPHSVAVTRVTPAIPKKTKPVGRVSVAPNGTVTISATVGAFQNGNSVAVVPPAKSIKSAAGEAIAHENTVYDYIQSVQGARLTEIESALSLNRVQAVDALRSLIKKGLITQRDRIYLSQMQLAHT